MSSVELQGGRTRIVDADESAETDSDHIATVAAVAETKATAPSIKLKSAFYLFIAVMIGVSTVVQRGVNIALAQWIGSPLKSGFISFIVGTLSLSLTLCTPSGTDTGQRVTIKSMITNLVAECRLEKRNLFIFLNGPFGVIFLCSAIYIAPVIGYGLFAISLVFGQIITSTLIDHYGLIWSSKRTLSTINLCGPLLAICGDVLFQIPSFTQTEGMNPR